MRVIVVYTAQSRAAAGADQETVDLPEGASAADLLRQLADRHGEDLRRILLENGRPRPATTVFVNDVQVRSDAPPVLNDGDQVLILSPIFGG